MVTIRVFCFFRLDGLDFVHSVSILGMPAAQLKMFEKLDKLAVKR
jgi:hypothetical protein